MFEGPLPESGITPSRLKQALDPMQSVIQVHIKRGKKAAASTAAAKHAGTCTENDDFLSYRTEFFVPWPATGEAARRFQEPGEECCKADLNLLSHRNCFHRGRALLRN